MSLPGDRRTRRRGPKPGEYLGADENGREYYLLEGQVYSRAEPDGCAVRVGSLAARNRAEKLWGTAAE